MKKLCLLCRTLLTFLLWARETPGIEVSMEGDRLSVHADQVHLQAVLARIADLGVKVRIDAEINPVVSASFDDCGHIALHCLRRKQGGQLSVAEPGGLSQRDPSLFPVEGLNATSRRHSLNCIINYQCMLVFYMNKLK